MYVLYDYFRSSACYRVRIAMNLKKIPYSKVPVDLRKGEQKEASYKEKNIQGLVPALTIDAHILTQSLSIIEYLEETNPNPPLLPKDPFLKAQIRAYAYTISCDMHPLNNLRVLNHLTEELNVSEEQKISWYHKWLQSGFASLETMTNSETKFALTSEPSLADICLIPQIYNAIRFEFDMNPFPKLMRIYDNANKLEAFQMATP